MATNRKENPTLAAHVAEASGAEREIESHLAAHLLLVTRSKHQARLERQLESSKARVESLDSRLKELGGSVRSIPKPSKPAKQVKGAAKAAERRATKIATGSAKKVRDAAELRRVLEAARDEQEEALKQTAAYNSLRALAKASGDKDTAQARQAPARRAQGVGQVPHRRAQVAVEEAGQGGVRGTRQGDQQAPVGHGQEGGLVAVVERAQVLGAQVVGVELAQVVRVRLA